MMNLTTRKTNAADPVRDLFSAVIGDVASCCSGNGTKARMALDIVESEHAFEFCKQNRRLNLMLLKL